MDPTLAPAPPASDPARSDVPRHAFLALGLGAAAVVAFLAQLLLDLQRPLVVLAINLGLTAGAYGVLLLQDGRLRDAGNNGILQFMGFLAIALLGRVWLGQTAQGFAILFEYSPSLGALAIATAALMFRAFCTRSAPSRAALTNGLLGATAFGLLAIGLLATSTTSRPQNLVLLGLTCLIVPSLLGIQWWLAPRLPWAAAKAWPTTLGLALAGTQLFDGVLTYLVVADPLGIAPEGYEEQIPVSRFILDRFGIGFPIAKWALGLGIATLLAQTRFRSTAIRIALYLAVLAAGMGPGLFSAAQLF